MIYDQIKNPFDQPFEGSIYDIRAQIANRYISALFMLFIECSDFDIERLNEECQEEVARPMFNYIEAVLADMSKEVDLSNNQDERDLYLELATRYISCIVIFNYMAFRDCYDHYKLCRELKGKLQAKHKEQLRHWVRTSAFQIYGTFEADLLEFTLDFLDDVLENL